MTLYAVRVVGADSSVDQVCTVCTISQCFYTHQVTHVTDNYSIFVTSIKGDGTLGSHNGTTINGKDMTKTTVTGNHASWEV